MTVLVQDSSVRYIADGSQVEFAFDFKIFTDSDLEVYLDGVKQTIGYTILNSGEETNNRVTFDDPPDDQTIVYFQRVLPYQQLLDLIAFDRFPAESMEKALDYIVLLTQQNERETENLIKASPDMPDDVDLTLPAPGDGEFIKYKDDGSGFETADITKLEGQIISEATDTEIIEGVEGNVRLISPAQVKLGVSAHESPPITSIFNVQWVEVVDALPPQPLPTTLYLVREP